MSIKKIWSRNMGRLVIDPNQPGLVAGYDMVPNGVTLPDLSGNGNDGVISGPAFEFTEIGPSMKFDGIVDEINCGSGFQALTDLTVSMWIKTPGLQPGEFPWLFNYYQSTLNEWGVQIGDVAGTLKISIYDDIDDAGVSLYETTLTRDTYHHIVAQMDNLENKLFIDGVLVGSGVFAANNWSSFAGILYLGTRIPVVNYDYWGNMSNVKILDRVWTLAEIQAECQAGAQAINWKSDYGVDASIAPEGTPGELSNSVARIESGTHIMTTDTIHGGIKKVIESVTAGIVQIPIIYYLHGDETQAAYGTFECWIYKHTQSLEFSASFINNSPLPIADVDSNGYGFIFTTSGRIQLVRMTGASVSSLFFTAPVYKPTDTWLKVKITRSMIGEFTMYINDEIVDVTGGAGTNPVTDATHTISRHITFDLQSGDKIAWAGPNGECAITKYQGVI